MAQTIKLKRSSTGGAVPSTSSLSLGEVAINTYDGKMYIKKNDGSDAIVEIGAGTSAVWKSYDYTATSSQTSFSGNDNNSDSLSYVAGFVQVFLNGILLDPAVDYTATTGSSIVLTSGASTGDLLQIESFTQIIGTGDILVDTFPVSSTQTAFTLSQDPVNKSNISVYVEGVYQESSTYSLSTTTLTLSESPANGTTVEVVIGTRNVTLDNIADLTISGTLHAGALDLGDANIINVNEISLDTIKGDADANTNITFAGSDVTTFTQGGQERLRLNTTGAQVTGNIVVSGTVDGRDVAADGVTADAALSRAGGAMGGAITTNSTFDGRDVSVDGTKLDGIESGATADQTDVEIRAAVESASDSNVFTNADHTKLDGIEALADVTDATNVTASGALMDSEVTNLAQVKAFDSSDYATAAQGTTANAALPKAGGTMTGTLNGGAANFSNAVKIGGWLTGASNTNTLFSHTFLGTIIQTPSNTDNAAGSFFIKDSAGVTHFTLNTNTDVSTFTGTISSGAISATGSANSGSASHLPAFLASGNYGGGIATRDTKESGWYQQTNGADWHFYHNRTVASDTPASKIVLSFNSSGNSTFSGTVNSAALTVTGNSFIGNSSTHDADARLHVAASDTSPDLSATTPASYTAIFSNSDGAYGTTFGSLGTGVGLIQQRRTDAATYYGLSLQPYGGSVGIGTATPTHKLNVVGGSGTAVVESIRNPSTSWSQYALTRYGTEGADFRYMDFGYYRGASEATRGLVIKSQANATLVTFLDSGNVGIGTTAPGALLDLETPGNTVDGTYYSTMTINNTGSSTYSGVRFDRSAVAKWRVGIMPDDTFHIAKLYNTADDGAFVIDSNGKVGIGIEAPSGRLHVDGHTSSLPTILEGNSNGDTVPLLFRTKANNGNVTNYGIFGNSGSSGATNTIHIGPTNASGLSVNSSGNVGIGTSNQLHPLHIQFDDSTAYSGTSDQGGGIYSNNIHYSALQGFSQIRLGVSGGSGASYARLVAIEPGQAQSDFAICLRNSSTYFERLRIKGLTGNIGIGTDAPAHKLQVEGALKTNPPVQTGNRQRSVQTWETSFSMLGTTATNWDMTKFNEGGAGNAFLVEAFWSHYASSVHSLALVAIVHTRGTAIHQQTIYNHTHANNGSFTISAPSATTLRINKLAGTYGGTGYGTIRVTSYQP